MKPTAFSMWFLCLTSCTVLVQMKVAASSLQSEEPLLKRAAVHLTGVVLIGCDQLQQLPHSRKVALLCPVETVGQCCLQSSSQASYSHNNLN